MRRVLWIGLFLNLSVAAAKLVAGLIAGSLAVQGDALHSLIDGINNIVGLVALAYAAAPPDREHPYGHGKIETLAAFGVAGLICVTAFELARAAVSRLAAGMPTRLPDDLLVPSVMLATLLVNIGVSQWEQRRGRELGSDFLLADAAHTRSDILVTLAVIASWGFVKMGYPSADPLATLLVVVFIARIGFLAFARTVPVLIDAARIPLEKIRQEILAVPGVAGCDRLRHRGEGSRAYVECRIHPADAADAAQAHQLTEEIEGRLESRFGIPPENITIHVEAKR